MATKNTTTAANNDSNVTNAQVLDSKFFIDKLVDEAESNPAWQALKKAGEEAIAKNAKKTGLEKLCFGMTDGILRMSPALVGIDPTFNERDLNNREAVDKLLILAQSIKAEGVKQPIVMKKDGNEFNAEDGHRRFYATMIAVVRLGATDLKSVPVRMGEKHASDADRVFSQYILNSGEKPTPFEMGAIFSRLVKLGWTEAEIVTKSGLSKSRVSQLLDMHTVPSEVKALGRHPEVVLKPSFIYDRFLANKRDGHATVEELIETIMNAKEGGYDRATAKHLPDTAADGQAQRRAANRQTPSAPQASSRIVPGQPAGNAPLPQGTTDRTPVVQTDRNKNFRAAARQFFRDFIEVDDSDRDNKGPVKFKLVVDKFPNREMWVMIRDGLDI